MKLILENFRQFNEKQVLMEDMNTVDDLPDDVGIKYQFKKNQLFVSFYDEEWDYNLDEEENMEDYPDDYPYGYLIALAQPGNKNEPCSGAFIMSWVTAKDGWGPLLYDVAMELTTKAGSGLTADRVSVSRDAYKIWRYYYYKRDDIETVQLDDPYGSLTPDDHSDDCTQTAAINMSKKTKFKWYELPISKMYKKPDLATITKLDKIGKLFEA